MRLAFAAGVAGAAAGVAPANAQPICARATSSGGPLGTRELVHACLPVGEAPRCNPYPVAPVSVVLELCVPGGPNHSSHASYAASHVRTAWLHTGPYRCSAT